MTTSGGNTRLDPSNRRNLAPKPATISTMPSHHMVKPQNRPDQDGNSVASVNDLTLLYQEMRAAGLGPPLAVRNWIQNNGVPSNQCDKSPIVKRDNEHTEATLSSDEEDGQSLTDEDINLEEAKWQKNAKLYWLSEETEDGRRTYRSREEGLAAGFDPLPILHKWYESAFIACHQCICKHIAKIWIKCIHPKKQTKYPYSVKTKPGQAKDNHQSAIPRWWPKGVKHKEPDHINSPARIALLMTIFLDLHGKRAVEEGPIVNVDLLYTALEQSKICIMEDRSDKGKQAWAILDNICTVRKDEERYLSGEWHPGNRYVSLQPYDKPLRGARGKRNRTRNPVKRARSETSSSLPKAIYTGSLEASVDQLRLTTSGSHHPQSNNYGSSHDVINYEEPYSLTQSASSSFGPMATMGSYIPTPPPSERSSSPRTHSRNTLNIGRYASNSETWQTDYPIHGGSTYHGCAATHGSTGDIVQQRSDVYMQQHPSIPAPTTNSHIMYCPPLQPSTGPPLFATAAPGQLSSSGVLPSVGVQESQVYCNQLNTPWTVVEHSPPLVTPAQRTGPGMFAWNY